MHIQSFEFFYKVCLAKSISKVANESHISQSALSQQIQKLENSLGYELFIRSNKGVELTKQGEVVFRYAENLIRTYKKMLEELDNLSTEEKIIVEGSYPIATYSLPCSLFRLKQKYPNYNYELITNYSDNIIEDVSNDICDLGFVIKKPDNNILSNYKMGIERIALVADPKYNIEKSITIDELFKHPIIMLDNKFKIKNQLEEIFKKAGHDIKNLNVVFNFDSIEAVKSSVFKGYGISFLPYSSVKQEIYKKQLKLVKIKEVKMHYEIYLITKKDEFKTQSVIDFVEYFKEFGPKSFC